MGEHRKKSKTRATRPRDAAFAARLRDAMEDRRVRPGELARLVPASGQSVSRWRAGEQPDDVRLARIADVLAVSLNWLTTGQGEMNAAEAGRWGVPPRAGAQGDTVPWHQVSAAFHRAQWAVGAFGMEQGGGFPDVPVEVLIRIVGQLRRDLGLDGAPVGRRQGGASG